MSNRSMKVTSSALAIVLGLAGVGAIGFEEGAIAQEQTSEIDRAWGYANQSFVSFIWLRAEDNK